MLVEKIIQLEKELICGKVQDDFTTQDIRRDKEEHMIGWADTGISCVYVHMLLRNQMAGERGLGYPVVSEFPALWHFDGRIFRFHHLYKPLDVSCLSYYLCSVKQDIRLIETAHILYQS